MTNTVISEEELKQLLTPNFHKVEKEQSQKPKLTMKYLYVLITDLQHENLMLAKRVYELEQQLDEFHQIRVEVSATVELADMEINSLPPGVETVHPINLPQEIRITRSERHLPQKKKKKSFWTLWSRPRTS